MTNLIKFDGFDGSEIRVTDDGRYSVFDVIAFCGKKSQSEVWKRLCVQFPEVLTKCDNFKFPGKGQRETPVASREGFCTLSDCSLVRWVVPIVRKPLKSLLPTLTLPLN